MPFLIQKPVKLTGFYLELAKGVEPPTCALQVRCSTTELRQHFNTIQNRLQT